MYIGIFPEEGKRVHDEDAFSYACERIERGTGDEKADFMDCAKESADFEEFKKDFVDWFYSGNWIYESEKED